MCCATLRRYLRQYQWKWLGSFMQRITPSGRMKYSGYLWDLYCNSFWMQSWNIYSKSFAEPFFFVVFYIMLYTVLLFFHCYCNRIKIKWMRSRIILYQNHKNLDAEYERESKNLHVQKHTVCICSGCSIRKLSQNKSKV